MSRESAVILSASSSQAARDFLSHSLAGPQTIAPLPRVCAQLAQLTAQQVTDANAALFDSANNFRGCIAGLHEVLRRQGLMRGRTCLDPEEDLSPGQLSEIDRIYRIYPHLVDDEFVREHIDEWLGA